MFRRVTLLFVICAAPLALFASLTAAAEATPAKPGAIAGLVRDAATRQPLAQASVSVEGSKLGAMTDDAGRFLVPGVPAGPARLRAWRMDHPAIVLSDIAVQPGRTTEVVVELAAEAVRQQEVEVRARGFSKPRDQATSSFQMAYEEIRRSPGASGDVFRLVQSLPGVTNANDQRNDVIARGGSPEENLILVDNVELPSVSHFASQGSTGGPISMLNNELVREASFQAGGFPAQFGQRLSSVMDIRLREGSRERFQSQTDMSMAGFGQLCEGPLGKRGSWVASFAQGYLDLLAKPFGLEAVPHMTNGQAKLTWDATPADKWWLVHISGRDDIAADYDPDDLDDQTPVTYETSGWRTATGLNWQHLWGGRGWSTLGISDSYGRFDSDAWDPFYGNLHIYHNASSEAATTLRWDLAGRLLPGGEWKFGASAKHWRSRFELDQPFGTSNAFSTDTTRVNAIALRRTAGDEALGGYAQWSGRVARRLDLTIGARSDRYGALGATTFDPRAALTAHVRPTLDLSVSWGVHHQQPSLVFVHAYPQNERLAPIRAEHFVLGTQYTPTSDLRFTVEAYVKRYQSYPVAAEYPQYSLANAGDQYIVAGLLFPLVSEGRGRSQGIECFAQKKLSGHWHGQVSASVSRTEHAAKDGVMRRGGFDTPITATTILGWRPNERWECSGRMSTSSGRPYTAPLQPWSTEQNRYVMDLANMNAERTPAYFRLDLRVDRHHRLFGRPFTEWYEFQNVSNRENIFQMMWNSKRQRWDHLPQIGFLPVGGFTLYF